jgi:hypothetical protein
VMPTGSPCLSTSGANRLAAMCCSTPSTCWNSTARACGGPRSRPARQRSPAWLQGSLPGLRLNQHLAHPGDVVFQHACKMGLEGIVSKRLGSRYVSGRTRDWLKFKNPAAPAVKREAEEDWGR